MQTNVPPKRKPGRPSNADIAARQASELASQTGILAAEASALAAKPRHPFAGNWAERHTAAQGGSPANMARFLLAETSELFEMMSTYEGMENPPHAGLTKQPSIPDHSLINARIKAALQGIALGEITYGVPELSKDFHTLQAYFLQQRRHQLGTKYHTNDSEFNEAMIYQSSLPEHQKAKLAMTIFDSITSILGDLQVKGLSSDRFIFGSEPLRRADGFGR